MRVRSLAIVSTVLLATLAGCGDDGDDSPEAQTFCTVVEPIQALPTVLENPEDVASVEATMTAAESALATVTGAPPEGIEADVELVSARFEAANTALKAVDYDYAALADEDFDALNALGEPDFVTAADNIQAWSDDNC